MEAPTIQELAKQTYLKPMQKQQIEQGLRYAEEALRNHEMFRNTFGVDINVEEVQRVRDRDRRTLELGTPLDYDGATKNKLNKMRRGLEQEFTYDMPTEEQMRRPTATNVDMHMAWEKNHKKNVKAWRAICRILDPDNISPNFTNVERFRTNTPPKGDPRRYWVGFDSIQWEEDIEEELIAAIDDKEYTGFLELRTLGWAKANIIKQLEWTKEQYDAALERFRRSEFVTQADHADLVAEAAETFSELNIPKDIKKQIKASNPKPGKPSLLDSNIWPMPEARRIGMSLPQFRKLTGLANMRIVTVCGKNAKSVWSEREKALIEDTLLQFESGLSGVDDAPQEEAEEEQIS